MWLGQWAVGAAYRCILPECKKKRNCSVCCTPFTAYTKSVSHRNNNDEEGATIVVFFQTLRIRNKIVKLLYTVSEVIEKKINYVLYTTFTTFL